MRGRRYPDKRPAIDSPLARQNAMLFLCAPNADLANITAETLAHRYRLKPATARYMLWKALEERGLN